VRVTKGTSMELPSEDSTTNGAKVNLLRKQPSFQQLNPTEQEELKVKLYEDERNMKLQFASLVTRTCDSIEDRISVVRFTRNILALGAFEPAPGSRDRSLLDEHKEEIKKAQSISEIFVILNSYWNYLTYDVLEYIIQHCGTNDDEENLKCYNEELDKFCKRRIVELSPESQNGNTLNPKQKKFTVKLNFHKDCTCEEHLQIRGRIAKILKVNLAVLVLIGMDEGCVQLTFLIPKFVAEEIFPLSDDQTSVLSKNVSVIRLECGQYIFEVGILCQDTKHLCQFSERMGACNSRVLIFLGC